MFADHWRVVSEGEKFTSDPDIVPRRSRQPSLRGVPQRTAQDGLTLPVPPPSVHRGVAGTAGDGPLRVKGDTIVAHVMRWGDALLAA